MSHNNITSFPNLSVFKNVIILDLSDNNLTSIPKLPSVIEELTIKNNKITEEQLSDYSSLKRVDISNNKLSKINTMNSLEILICDNNAITHVDTFPKLKSKLNCARVVLQQSSWI